MPVTRAHLLALVLITSACIGPIKEYSEDGAGDSEGEGDSPSESDEAARESEGEDEGDGDGDGGDENDEGEPTGDGDGDPGDGDGDDDCPLGSPGCPCGAGKCEPGHECVAGLCELSDYPWGQCGWNPRYDWYDCQFEGESPDPAFPIDCGDLPLVNGAPCPQGFTVKGCCAVGGELWWCEDGKVERRVCGA